MDEIVRTMRPHLEALGKTGVTGFVDCTLAYLSVTAEAVTGQFRS
jgi:hypothetical protein